MNNQEKEIHASAPVSLMTIEALKAAINKLEDGVVLQVLLTGEGEVLWT